MIETNEEMHDKTRIKTADYFKESITDNVIHNSKKRTTHLFIFIGMTASTQCFETTSGNPRRFRRPGLGHGAFLTILDIFLLYLGTRAHFSDQKTVI